MFLYWIDLWVFFLLILFDFGIVIFFIKINFMLRSCILIDGLIIVEFRLGWLIDVEIKIRVIV